MQSILNPVKTLFVCIDLQEKLLSLMSRKDEVVKNANLLLRVAQILGAQTLITEQYPKGLGSTHEGIEAIQGAVRLEKTSFGIFNDEGIKEFITKSGCETLVIFGIESHICVLQSVIDALNFGFECIVASDALSSRNESHHKIALDFFKQKGASVLPSQSIVFGLLGDSKHPNFKELSALIK